jgi:hypothetical protein
MSTPKLRDDEIAVPGRPRARIVTTTRKMAKQRYHYVAGAAVIWRQIDGGSREPVRMVVHTLCRGWVTLPNLVEDAHYSEICDLCMLQQSREWDARRTSGQVDF